MSDYLAYIDPATGSLIFQALLAGLLGIGVAVKAVRNRILGFFSAVFSRRAKEDASGPQGPADPTDPASPAS